MALRELKFNGGKVFLKLIKIIFVFFIFINVFAAIPSIKGKDLFSDSQISLNLEKKTVVFFSQQNAHVPKVMKLI